MRKLTITLCTAWAFISLSVCSLQAQTQSSGNWGADSSFLVQARVYGQAAQINDWEVAITALHNMLALRPERADLLDSLALVYYNNQQFVQSKLVASTVTRGNPENLTMWLISAMSNEKLGLVKDALKDYEQLYSRTEDLYYLYQVIVQQYALKRYGECTANIDQVLAIEGASEEEVTLYFNKTEQKVPMRAAVLNLKGVIALEMGNRDFAKGCFEDALEIMPNFELAKGNLESMDKEDEKTDKSDKGRSSKD